ncbi:MAG: SIS domain-containing protein [Acidobacteria bacterium]|nr:SIS domain-containing protein [Acidobacteriota bacterium]
MSSIAERSFPHFMLKEIWEQPDALRAALERYTTDTALREDLFAAAREVLGKRNDVVIAASGSSRHAGLTAEISMEDFAGLAVDVEYASEYSVRSTNTKRDPAVIVISQSGETADTLAALREAKARGHKTIAVTNVATSTMARECDASMPTMAGVEKAIPATKSFTTQLLVLHLLALFAAQERGTMNAEEIASRVARAHALPEQLESHLPKWEAELKKIAPFYASARTFLFLGRGIHYAIAREGALKLKESSYLHAEGYPAGELKHGPNALVSPEVPLIVLATYDAGDEESVNRYEKTVQLLADMKQQGATVLAIVNDGDERVRALVTHAIDVPATSEHLLPIVEVVPLQLLAYFIAIRNGVNVDQPRNLTKAVLAD